MNESVFVTNGSLIKLRQAGESLALPSTRIRANQAGTYLSQYKGRGMEFEEHRLYQPGDDIRNIDWRVTARTGHPHTKVFREERERPVLFCVDLRRSMHFATRGVFKSVMAARAAALLAWSSHHHGDRVGGFVFSDARHQELRPQRGKGAVLKLIHALSKTAAASDKPGETVLMDKALARLRRVGRPGSLICILSDFRGWTPNAESHLLQLAQHNTIWLLFVFDPVEAELPHKGIYKVSDGSRQTVVNTHGEDVRQRYVAQFQTRQGYLETLCRRHRMSLIPVGTQADLLGILRNELVTRSTA